MKKYMKPMMEGQIFTSNEYVAACGDSGTVYKFTCDADGGSLYYYPKSDPSKTFNIKTVGSAEYIGWSYSPCEKYHEAESTSGFYWGFVDYDRDGEHDTEEHTESGHFGSTTYPAETVIVWRGPDGKNGHATTALDMTKWETAKS